MRRLRERRVVMALPVRVWGMDLSGKLFDVEAQTVNITPVGARISGISFHLRRGAVIGIQCGRSRARFRVTWTGQAGTPSEGHIGVQCVETGKYIWGVALRRVLEEEALPAASSLLTAAAI